MFQVMNANIPVEEEEEDFIDDYFSSEEAVQEQYEELPDPTQFVEVTNPEFLENMLSNNAASLEALLDFQADLTNLNLINTEAGTKQDLSFSTPLKKEATAEITTPITFNQMIFGEDSTAFNTPILERDNKRDTNTTPAARKTYGGKSIILYNRYEYEDEEEIDILGDLEEDTFSPVVVSSTKKRKNSKNSKTPKKSKSKSSPSTQKPEGDSFESVSVVYNILTQLDTPPTKAKHLEKSISKVFMGEELVKMQKNCEEDDYIEII